MAKLGQIYSSYTDELREKVTIELVNGEIGYKAASEKYGVSTGTLGSWVRKYRTRGTTKAQKKPGRPKQPKNEVEKLRLQVEILKNFHDFLKDQPE